MFGSLWLEVAIGLVFVFFLVSLVASAVVESISRALSQRSQHLEAALIDMLTGGEGGPISTGVARTTEDLVGLLKGVREAADAATGEVVDHALAALTTIHTALLATDADQQVISKDLFPKVQNALDELDSQTAKTGQRLASEIQSVFTTAGDQLRYLPVELLRSSATYRSLGRASKKVHTALPASVANRWPFGRSVSQSTKARSAAPSYISAKDFADVSFDLLGAARTDLGDVTSIELEQLTDRLPAGLRTRLDRTLAVADASMLEVRADLEGWFDSTMDRVEGAYRRWSQAILFIVGLAVAGLLNASAINMAVSMYADDAVAEAVANLATSSQLDAESDSVKEIAAEIDDLQQLDLPFGWRFAEPAAGLTEAPSFWAVNGFGGFWASMATILGWFITASLVMLGAPFWFDLLTRLVALRSAGSKPPSAADDSTSATSQLESARKATVGAGGVGVASVFGVKGQPLVATSAVSDGVGRAAAGTKRQTGQAHDVVEHEPEENSATRSAAASGAQAVIVDERSAELADLARPQPEPKAPLVCLAELV